jgi:phosphate uptake regulator
MSDAEFSLEDVARYWDDNAAAWAREVRQGHDVARELLNNYLEELSLMVAPMPDSARQGILGENVARAYKLS